MASKIRAINQGTRYDCAGMLRQLTRRIENGEINPLDILVVTSEPTGQPCSSPKVILRHFGSGTTENIHWMLSTAKNRIEPA